MFRLVFLSREQVFEMDRLFADARVSPNGRRALGEALLGGVAPSDASVVVREALELINDWEGDDPAQAWLIVLLSSVIPPVREFLSSDELLCLVMWANVLLPSAPAAQITPLLDLFAEIYAASVVRFTEPADDPSHEVLAAETEAMKQTVVSAIATDRMRCSSARSQSVSALRRLVMFLFDPHISIRQNACWVQGRCNQVATQLIETIAEIVLADSNPDVVLAAISSLEYLLRNCGAALPTLIPLVCKIAIGQTPGMRKGGSAALRQSPSCSRSFQRCLAAAAARAPTGSDHYTAIRAAMAMTNTVDVASIPRLVVSPHYRTDASLVFAHIAVTAPGGPHDEDAQVASVQKESTSLGELAMSEIVQMVMISLRAIDVHGGIIENHHRRGLAAMQLAAAKRAQLAELERLRQQALRGIEGVPLGHLLEHIESGAASLQRAQAVLASQRSRELFVRAAFTSAMSTFRQLRLQSEARQLHAQALIARVVSQLPPGIADSGNDALCDAVLDLLEAAKLQGVSNGPAEADAVPIITRSSLFGLVLQTLFMRYSQLSCASATALATATDINRRQGDDTAVLHNKTIMDVLSLDDPISWMTQPVHRKRSRLDADVLLTDEPGKPPTPYTHLLCRLIATLFEVREASGEVDSHVGDVAVALLLHCPAITIPVWKLVHTTLRAARSKTGLRMASKLLAQIMIRRPVYRLQALSILLHETTVPQAESRQSALKELLVLLSAHGRINASSPAPWVEHVVAFARRCIGRIAHLRVAKFEAQEGPVIGPDGVEIPPEQAALQRKALAKEKLRQMVMRYATLMVVLCTLRVSLFQELLNTVSECLAQQSIDAVDVLLRWNTLDELIGRLYADQNALVDIFQQLRSFPKGSERLVQHTLHVFQQKLVSSNDADKGGVYAQRHAQVAQALIGVCCGLFESSLVHVDGHPQRDVRFVIPILSFLPRPKLKLEFIPEILKMCVIPGREADVDAAFAEMMSPCTIAFGDDHQRGMSPADLLVYLHEVYQLPECEAAMVTAGISHALKMRVGTMLIFTPTLVSDVLLRLIKMRPVPTLTMRTAIIAARTHDDAALRRKVTNNVVKPLALQQVWLTDDIQWKGVIRYIQDLWPETSEVLFSLPQYVLRSVMQSNEKLRSIVMETLPQLPTPYAQMVSEVTSDAAMQRL